MTGRVPVGHSFRMDPAERNARRAPYQAVAAFVCPVAVRSAPLLRARAGRGLRPDAHAMHRDPYQAQGAPALRYPAALPCISINFRTKLEVRKKENA